MQFLSGIGLAWQLGASLLGLGKSPWNSIAETDQMEKSETAAKLKKNKYVQAEGSYTADDISYPEKSWPVNSRSMSEGRKPRYEIHSQSSCNISWILLTKNRALSRVTIRIVQFHLLSAWFWSCHENNSSIDERRHNPVADQRRSTWIAEKEKKLECEQLWIVLCGRC